MTQSIARKLPREGAQVRPDRFTRSPGASDPEGVLLAAVAQFERQYGVIAEQVARLRVDQRRLLRRVEQLERRDAPDAEPLQFADSVTPPPREYGDRAPDSAAEGA